MNNNSSILHFETEVCADTSNLLKIREQLTQFLNEINFDKDNIIKVLLVVDEYITNIIRYSYKEDSSKSIKMIADSDGYLLKIEVFDDGDSFNVLDYQTNAIEDHIKRPHKGGLGIPFMKLFANSIEYFPKSEKSKSNVTRFKFISN
jgi:anti-sigma regulatory factor (Ser/Thr protein kinase)